MEIRHKEISDQVICCFYNVFNRLGSGFLEKVYQNSMLIELAKTGMAAIPQHPISVYYEGETVGEYFADILVQDKVVLEIKAVKTLAAEHEAQLVNYLKATGIEVGLLLNFGSKPQFKRKVFTQLEN